MSAGREGILNRRDLVAKIAEDAQLSRLQASRALDAFVAGIQQSLVRGDRVTLVGFGSFTVLKRKGRAVKEPRRGLEMQIPPRRVPRFSPGVELRAAVEKAEEVEAV